jgi:hypothetical protein
MTTILIERHGKIAARTLQLPGSYLFARLSIHDRNLCSIRHVHENSRGGGVELKAFRMTSEGNLCDLRTGGIEHCQGTFPIADKYLIGSRIDPDIVSVIAKIDAPELREVLTPEKPQGAVSRVRHVKRVCCGEIANALRLSKAADSAGDLGFLKVDHPDGIVAEFRNEEPLVTRISGEMVDPALDLPKDNLGFKHQRPRLRPQAQ